MSDYKIGRGRPPKEKQFLPGQSGNPRGRPRKAPRAAVPSQLLEDFRMISQMPVPIRTADGSKMVPGVLAVMYGILKGAVEGKPTALRMYMKFLELSYQDNVDRDPILYLLDAPRNDRLRPDTSTKEGAELIKYLADRSLKPRRSRSAS